MTTRQLDLTDADMDLLAQIDALPKGKLDVPFGEFRQRAIDAKPKDDPHVGIASGQDGEAD